MRSRFAVVGSALALSVAALLALPAGSAAQTACGVSDPGDRFIVSGDTTVAPDDPVGDLTVLDGDVRLLGPVSGDVFVASGDIVVRGCVGGDVTAITGKMTLLRGARVGGDLIYSDQRPLIGPGAEVAGDVREENWDDFGDLPWEWISAVALWIAMSASLLVSGTTLVALLPRAAEATAEAARSQFWLAVAMGLAVLIGLPLLSALSFVTLLGIPLSIVLGFAVVPLAWLGYLVCCFVLGRLVTNDGVHPILAFLAGLGILRAIALIPIAGAIAWIPAVIIGLGALVVAAMDREEAAKA